MGMGQIKVAELDRERISRVQDLERDLGCTVVAFAEDYRPAELNEEQVRKLQRVEKELGVVLVAFQKER